MRDHIIHASRRRSGRSKRRDRHLFSRGLRNPRARVPVYVCIYYVSVCVSVYYTIIIIVIILYPRRLRHLVRERRRVLLVKRAALSEPYTARVAAREREKAAVYRWNGMRKQKKNKVRNPPQKHRGR